MMHSHGHVPLLPIGSTMPNVQAIDAFFTGSCEECDIDFGYDSEEDENRIEAEGDLYGYFEQVEDSYEDYNEDNEEDDWESDSNLTHGPGKTCFRPVFAHWMRECPSLRKILYNFESVLGPAEELLEE